MVQIVGRNRDVADVVEDLLKVKAFIVSGSADLGFKGNSFFFNSSIIAMTNATVGVEIPFGFIQNESETFNYHTGTLGMIITDLAAEVRNYVNVETDNAPTTAIPRNTNATSTKEFIGDFRISDGSTTTTHVLGSGYEFSVGLGPSVFPADESFILGRGNSVLTTVKPTTVDAIAPGIAAIAFYFNAGGYRDAETLQ